MRDPWAQEMNCLTILFGLWSGVTLFWPQFSEPCFQRGGGGGGRGEE